jgi:hypothetical protein
MPEEQPVIRIVLPAMKVILSQAFPRAPRYKRPPARP